MFPGQASTNRDPRYIRAGYICHPSANSCSSVNQWLLSRQSSVCEYIDQQFAPRAPLVVVSGFMSKSNPGCYLCLCCKLANEKGEKEGRGGWGFSSFLEKITGLFQDLSSTGLFINVHDYVMSRFANTSHLISGYGL